MSLNTDADKFWRIFTWAIIIAAVGGAAWWAYSTRTPDLPFYAWLASASRDDVWRAAFSCILFAVIFGRIAVRSNAR